MQRSELEQLILSVALADKRLFVKNGQRTYHRLGIRRARRFAAGMHRELRYTDIDRAYRELRCGDVSERRAAGHIRAVGIVLRRDSRLLAYETEKRGGHTIGRVVLRSVVLYHNTAAEHGRMRRVG